MPWKYSRIAIGAIASVGIIETGYLTLARFLGAEAICPIKGCNTVLSGPYATILGQPLSLFGLLAYLWIFTLSALPVFWEQPTREKLERQTKLLLFLSALAMTIFSGYLMYLLTAKIHAVCIYCIISAVLSFSLLITTVIGYEWEDVGQLVFSGIITSILVLIGTIGVYAPVSASPIVTGHIGPTVTTLSGQAEVALAKHLKSVGAKMYSAYWCPHCYDQKQKFGQQAMAYLPYVECAPDGVNAQTALCKQKNVQGFPTWEINGELYSGTQSLEALADLSGYQGPRDWKS